MQTILLVEDEFFIRDLYHLVLSKQGYHVVDARDGLEGVELALEVKPDLILLDIMMPRLNGIEALEKLVANPMTKHIPVVLCTNIGQGSIIKNALRKGARGYLMKVQFSPYEIVQQVKTFLENPAHTTDMNSLDLE